MQRIEYKIFNYNENKSFLRGHKGKIVGTGRILKLLANNDTRMLAVNLEEDEIYIFAEQILNKVFVEHEKKICLINKAKSWDGRIKEEV